jgi:hypothetical protein
MCRFEHFDQRKTLRMIIPILHRENATLNDKRNNLNRG